MSTLNIQSLWRTSKRFPKNYRYFFPELVPWLTLKCSNYPCLERISMVPKIFEPLRFDCINAVEIFSFQLKLYNKYDWHLWHCCMIAAFFCFSEKYSVNPKRHRTCLPTPEPSISTPEPSSHSEKEKPKSGEKDKKGKSKSHKIISPYQTKQKKKESSSK